MTKVKAEMPFFFWGFIEFFYLGKTLAGIVMEAPFINIHQALQTHYFALVSEFISLNSIKP